MLHSSAVPLPAQTVMNHNNRTIAQQPAMKQVFVSLQAAMVFIQKDPGFQLCQRQSACPDSS
jgi:hypothetical protein